MVWNLPVVYLQAVEKLIISCAILTLHVVILKERSD